jgi:hypothetical protein
VSPRLARFTVETERLADGRAIHFYAWPDDPAPEGAEASSNAGGSDAPATVPYSPETTPLDGTDDDDV